MRWIGLVPGLVLLAVTATSVVATLLLPRASSPLLTTWVARFVFRCFAVATARIRAYSRRDRVWALGAPTFLITLLTTWLALLVLGFALLLWPFTAGSFAGALRLAGSSVFTLGFAAPNGAMPTVLVFAAAAAGLVVIALQIAYLPTLYAAFNRRETLVTQLETLAGSPAWGPEILARYLVIDSVDQLDRLYDRWTEWAADLSESHTSYRTLIYFRSPEPSRSWLLALLSVLDAAALHLALNPEHAPAQARILLRMGYPTLRKLARGIGVTVEDDPQPHDPIQLTRTEFDHAFTHLTATGWATERDGEEAWRHFRGWRVNYETAAYALTRHLDVAPAPWSGPRRGTRRPRPADRPAGHTPPKAS